MMHSPINIRASSVSLQTRLPPLNFTYQKPTSSFSTEKSEP